MDGMASPIEYDPDLDQYVGIALDGHEVYGDTRRECNRKLRGTNDVIVKHQERNPMEPDWEALAEEEPVTEYQDSLESAEGPTIQ